MALKALPFGKVIISLFCGCKREMAQRSEGNTCREAVSAHYEETFGLCQDGISFLIEMEFSIPEGFQSEAVCSFINMLSKDIKTWIAIINWTPKLFKWQSLGVRRLSDLPVGTSKRSNSYLLLSSNFFPYHEDLMKCRPFPQKNTGKYNFDTATEVL